MQCNPSSARIGPEDKVVLRRAVAIRAVREGGRTLRGIEEKLPIGRGGVESFLSLDHDPMCRGDTRARIPNLLLHQDRTLGEDAARVERVGGEGIREDAHKGVCMRTEDLHALRRRYWRRCPAEKSKLRRDGVTVGRESPPCRVIRQRSRKGNHLALACSVGRQKDGRLSSDQDAKESKQRQTHDDFKVAVTFGIP